MIIGISGKSGSGKSSVSRYLASKINYKLVEVDKLSKDIRDEYAEEIKKLFFNNMEGEVDSKRLGNVLFDNPLLLKRYNEYIYDRLKIKIEKIIKNNANVIIDTIFLPIMDIYYECDYKILVVCDENVRKERIMLRDNISLEYLNKREKYAPFYKKEEFDCIINNELDYIEQIEDFIRRIFK